MPTDLPPPPPAFGGHIAGALVSCQLIEEALKRYIGLAFSEIRSRLDGAIPFKFAGAQYKNAPLGELLAVFALLTDNDALLKRLSKLKTDRNFVAHRALVECLRTMTDFSEHEAHMVKLARIRKEASKCFLLVNKEIGVLFPAGKNVDPSRGPKEGSRG